MDGCDGRCLVLPANRRNDTSHQLSQLGLLEDAEALPANTRIDLHVGAAIEESIYMIFGKYHNPIKGHSGIVDSIAIKAHSIKKRNLQVFEGAQSRVFDEAENRMHSIKAVVLANLR